MQAEFYSHLRTAREIANPPAIRPVERGRFAADGGAARASSVGTLKRCSAAASRGRTNSPPIRPVELRLLSGSCGLFALHVEEMLFEETIFSLPHHRPNIA